MSEAQSKPGAIFKIWCFILGLALLLTGLFYLIGGGKLISLGGSWYFFIAGLVTIVSAIFIFRKQALGVGLFSLVFIGTVIWALIDTGLEFWPLHSRLMFPAGLFAAVLFTLPSIRKYQQQTAMSAPAYVVGGLTVLGMLGGLYGIHTQPFKHRVRNCHLYPSNQVSSKSIGIIMVVMQAVAVSLHSTKLTEITYLNLRKLGASKRAI